MNLVYDPAENERFWEKVRRLPGFPHKDHIPLRKMVFASGALFRLPEILLELSIQPQAPILLVMDPTPMRRGADSLKPLVQAILEQAGWQVEPLVLEPDASGQVHTDMVHIQAVQDQLRSEHAVVSVGSGVVTDITKHACYLYEQAGNLPLPYVVYQTANSVSAYTSNMAPVFVQGVKRTLASRYPDALVCDLETLVDAPREMTAAGVGDMLAIYASLPDWYLAFQLGMDDGYSELAQQLLGPLDEIFLVHAAEIKNPSLEGMAVLAKLISLGGLAMSLSHATTPLSGYEHVISHVLDMIREHRATPLAQHGSQVALATVQVSHAYQAFLNRFDPNRVDLAACYPAAEQMQAQIQVAFAQVDPSGRAGEECWSDYRQKLERWQSRPAKLAEFCAGWEKHKAVFRALTRPPERVREILERIDAPLHFCGLEPPAEQSDVRFAFYNAPLMRKRLTLGDLLIFFNWDRDRIWGEIQAQGYI